MIITVKIDTEKNIMDQVKDQLPSPTYIVKSLDVGRVSYTTRYINGVMECPFSSLGVVLLQDVGKKCVKQNGVWKVENQEQFEARVGRNN